MEGREVGRPWSWHVLRALPLLNRLAKLPIDKLSGILVCEGCRVATVTTRVVVGCGSLCVLAIFLNDLRRGEK